MKKTKENKNCYKCDDLATSREHIPPLCLFPEEKDIKTSIFRNNLITVASCDLHNSKKSKDDEFLMACLASIVGNNVIGLFHTFTKVKRSLERKGKDFINVLMKDSQNINFENKGAYKFPVLVGRPDFNNLHSCFQHIACGLFYHKFGRRIDGECHVLMDFLKYDNDRMETYKLLCRKRTEVEPNKPKIEGANPEIFQYEFFKPDEFGLIGLRMTFYQGAKVFVAFQALTAKKPFFLTAELINAGIKTFVHFDDGTQFEFS